MRTIPGIRKRLLATKSETSTHSGEDKLGNQQLNSKHAPLLYYVFGSVPKNRGEGTGMRTIPGIRKRLLATKSETSSHSGEDKLGNQQMNAKQAPLLYWPFMFSGSG